MFLSETHAIVPGMRERGRAHNVLLVFCLIGAALDPDLIKTVLKFPASQSKFWSSARESPKPTARNISVRVTIRVHTNPTAQRSNL